jgi:hypothetical protein
MVLDIKSPEKNKEGKTKLPKTKNSRTAITDNVTSAPAHGVIYSPKQNLTSFSTPPLKEYLPIIGEERMERLQRAAERLEGARVLELNATAQGGGVAEMLYSSVPFLNLLGIETEWKVISGNDEFFECTKGLHNLLQGMKGHFTQEMERAYYCTIADCARSDIIDSSTDIIMVNDPQPLGLHDQLDKTLRRRYIFSSPLRGYPLASTQFYNSAFH